MIGKPIYHPNKEKIKCICKFCGNEFFVLPSVIRKGRGKYCSKKCKSLGQEDRVLRICKQCGNEFFTYPSRTKMGLGKYCSKKCATNANIGENNPHWKGGSVKRICETCEQEFFVIRAKVKNNIGKYCSTECSGIARSGENAVSWRGGTSFLPYCSKFNKHRKEAVREFFGRKCLSCGSDELEFRSKLSVHHVDHDKDQGCNGKPFNLVPLCKNCHAKEIFREEEYKKYINKILEEGFKWGIWSKEEYIKKVMYPED